MAVQAFQLPFRHRFLKIVRAVNQQLKLHPSSVLHNSASVYVCVCTYVRTHVRRCMYVCTYVCMCVCMNVYVRTYACVFICGLTYQAIVHVSCIIFAIDIPDPQIGHKLVYF